MIIYNLFCTSMAFTQTNAQRELESRKILQEIQLKKQLLLKQGAVPNLNSIPAPILPLATTPPGTIPFGGTPVNSLFAETPNTSVQRSALHGAHSQSFGFFITQDSSFGNLILPVVPRVENK